MMPGPSRKLFQRVVAALIVAMTLAVAVLVLVVEAAVLVVEVL